VSTSAGAVSGAAVSSAPAHGDVDAVPFDLDAGWRLHPRAAVRPESFGALLYHFGTRRLSFLKSPALRTVVESLADHPTAADACRAAGISASDRPMYARALATLAASQMIVPKGEQ
jgi:mycofactocin biosynthesis protein MftB